VLASHADLEAALAVARAAPALPLWCVYGKGKHGGIGDAAIRKYLRDHGYIDSKSCAVSDNLTATRYGAKQESIYFLKKRNKKLLSYG
jgi:hypothetical protein